MSKHLNPESADWLAETFARNRALFGGWSMEATGDDGGDADDDGSQDDGQGHQTFTQADIDKIIDGVVARERKKHAAEVKGLKADAEKGKTAEERIAELEKSVEQANREALRRRVQAAHGISDEDADLFLTGADEDSLTAQATRLAARESERKKSGNHVPSEGKTTPKPGEDVMRDFTRGLFKRQD